MSPIGRSDSVAGLWRQTAIQNSETFTVAYCTQMHVSVERIMQYQRMFGINASRKSQSQKARPLMELNSPQTEHMSVCAVR